MHARLRGDCGVRGVVGGGQHDPGPLHQPIRRRGPPGEGLQRGPFIGVENDHIGACRGHRHVLPPGTAGPVPTRRSRCGTMTTVAKSPPESTKTPLRQRLTAHARERWPALAAVDVRYHGTFAYVTGRLPDDTMLPLCRLRWACRPVTPTGRTRSTRRSCRAWSRRCRWATPRAASTAGPPRPTISRRGSVKASATSRASSSAPTATAPRTPWPPPSTTCAGSGRTVAAALPASDAPSFRGC